MMDLFDTATPDAGKPLAAAMRPETLDDVVGQEHITGKGTLLRRRIQAGRLGSLILYGRHARRNLTPPSGASRPRWHM